MPQRVDPFRKGVKVKFRELAERAGELRLTLDDLDRRKLEAEQELDSVLRKMMKLADAAQELDYDVAADMATDFLRAYYRDASTEDLIVRTLMIRPQHEWSVQEIASKLEREGLEVQEATLRAALSRATKRGEIKRVERGRYTFPLDDMVQEALEETGKGQGE